ncbi:MAG: sugar ABC transporter ATP-binding protein [Spirochaeta sp.]|jgi:simple sugar transport system ATP-binding protein|nr:sugar ABC transporter ATP-binding protein [Spirochaeta sp.]
MTKEQTMAGALLKATDVSKSFAAVQALEDVSFSIEPAEVHALAGENGSGKSTLIKVISGVHAPDSGTIEIEGTTFERLTPMQSINQGIQVIYQDFSVFPNLSVMENLAVNSELAEHRFFVNRKRMRAIAEEAVSRIGFDVDLDDTVESLSVAQKQMIAISRALIFNTRLIIMDEPTTALTKKEVDTLFETILKLKERGIATLFVSHKLNEVFDISEKFTILRSGKVAAHGAVEDLTEEKFSFHMTGRTFEKHHFEPTIQSEEPILEVKGIGREPHFRDVSFSLKRGEILGITGLLDSGRSQVALSLFGIAPVDSGQVLLEGKPVTIDTPQAAIQHKIGFVPEDRLTEGLFLPQSIADNVVVGEIDELTKRFSFVDAEKRATEVEKWVGELAIATPNPDNACLTLSGGNQQRVVLAKWLACDLDILVLNGPTVGVDIGSKYDIHGILQGLAKQGLSLIIVSDDLPEILENCSRILVMKSGEVVADLDSEKTDESEILSYMM